MVNLTVVAIIKMLLLLELLQFIEHTNAFYAFEPSSIDPSQLASDTVCDIVTCKNIIAYSCDDFLKVFLVGDDESELLYSTTKSVV